MTGSFGVWSRRVAARGIIAALPAAMVVAYSSNLFAPTPPRWASYSYVETAEIVDSPSTVGIADSNLYGMTDAEISTELDRLQSLGVTSIRVFVPWGLVEYADDTYNWSYIDSIMKAANDRDMGVMMEVNATPSWAAADSGSANYPAGSATPDVAKFTDFMGTLATRYGDTVSAYEIWNEPNYVSFSNPIDPAAYAELLKAVYPVLKEIDPTATVVAGALGTVQDSSVTMSAVTFVQQMLDAGAGDYFDAISVHPYQDTLLFSDGYSCNCGGQLTPLQEIDAIKALIGTDKTVWITEYGLSTVNGEEDEAKQAQYIQDLLDYWQTYSQAGPIFLYTGSDTATGSTDPEANYGLFYENGDLKQAAEMLAAWIAEHTTATTPTDPGSTDPGSTTQQTLQEAIQSIVNAVSETIRQAVQNVSVFAQAIVTAITNVITNVTKALASIGNAATVTTAVTTTSSTVTTAAKATASTTSTDADAATSEQSAESAKSSTKNETVQAATSDTKDTADTATTPSTTVKASSKIVEATATSSPVVAEAATETAKQGSTSTSDSITTETNESSSPAASSETSPSSASTAAHPSSRTDRDPAPRRTDSGDAKSASDTSEATKTTQRRTDAPKPGNERRLVGATSSTSSTSEGSSSESKTSSDAA